MIDPTALLYGCILAACLLDRLLGDPPQCLHPVVVMGWWIRGLRQLAERCCHSPRTLRCAGLAITGVLVSGSLTLGWAIEQLAWRSLQMTPPLWPVAAWMVLCISLASALAGRSLEQAVLRVLQALPRQENSDLQPARTALSWIVGRDTSALTHAEILRACAETASENAVDGLFAPLFWMLVGAVAFRFNPSLPGPLALAWGFKASSTLDSMLGYRQGTLRWLGTAGARLDDLLTWMPCRLVMLTLPLVSRPWTQLPALVAASERDGRGDPSPNAGRSEAIYAHCAGIRLGGRNRYGELWIQKPVLAKDQPVATDGLIRHLLGLTTRLELLWLMMPLLLIVLW